MTLYVRLKIVLLSFMLLLTGITVSRGEAFLCKNKAAIRATASVEAPLGFLSADEIQLKSGNNNETQAGRGTFWLFPGRGGAQLEIKIDGVRTDFVNPNLDSDNSLITDLDDNSKIKVIDPGQLLKKNAGGKTVTISIIYSEN